MECDSTHATIEPAKKATFIYIYIGYHLNGTRSYTWLTEKKAFVVMLMKHKDIVDLRELCRAIFAICKTYADKAEKG